MCARGCGDSIKNGEQMQRIEKLPGKSVSELSCRNSARIDLVLHAKNNEQFMTSVLLHVVENARERRCGLHTLDSVALKTLQAL